jgi:hypothetical protein
MKRISRVPDFSFFLSHNTPVNSGDTLWHAPIPMKRELFQGKPENIRTVSFSFGEYFCAARDFLMQNDYENLESAIVRQTSCPVRMEEIEIVQIHIEKHGEFYHPSRIKVTSEKLEISFVLNVGISKAGRDLVPKEFEMLDRLNRKISPAYIPGVYACGEVIAKDGFKIQMFLGEWFEGFQEFHVSFDETAGEFGICVWDPDQGAFFLTLEQKKKMYRQAASMLTHYYDVETFEQIFPWHHAAGDFVLRLLSEHIELRLVTVRGYTSLIKTNGGDAGSILESLLVFLLNLSIQMRLDRIDGTGDVMWSEAVAVEETIHGFFQALALKSPVGTFSEPLKECFFSYLSRWTRSELYDLSRAIVNLYNPLSPDVPVVKHNLKAHVAVFFDVVHSLPIDPGVI